MVIKCQLALLNALPYDTPSLRIHIDPRARLSRSCWSVIPCLVLYACTVLIPISVASSHESLMTKIRRSRPGQHSPAQGSCSRPACRSAIPRQSASVCIGCPILPGCRFNSPPTLRIAGPCLPGARRRVACRPSGFGARRGRRWRGSGCSCAVGRNAPSVSESGARNRRVQIW